MLKGSTILTLLGFVVSFFVIDEVYAQSYTGILELDQISSTIKTGNTVVFSGQLYTTSGHVVTDATIHIKDDVDFGRDDIVATLYTDSNGEFYGTWTAKPRSSGAWDFYAVFEGSSNISKARSYTQSVKVSSNYSSQSQSYSNSYEDYSTKITLNEIPSSIHAGETITFTGKLTSNGSPLYNKLVKVMEDDPFSPDQRIGYGRTDSNGNYKITWKVSAGLVETDFDFYAVYDGDSTYDRARSYNQEMSILKYGGSIVLHSFPSSAKIGEVVTFSGKLDLKGHTTQGAVVYIKDEDTLNPDDLLATGYVDEYGRFSTNWFVTNVDGDSIADIYAVFEGNDVLYRLTTCDSSPTRSFGGSCPDTIPLRISGYAKPPPNYVPAENEYMELYHSLNFAGKPHVAIVPSPDSYDKVRKHIIPVQEGIMMWETSLEDKFGGNWAVTFEVVNPGILYFESKPDVIVNLVSHDDHAPCFDDYYGIAQITTQRPVQTIVCSTSEGKSRSNIGVSGTAAHEFIHALGLGHTFNKSGDLMCSVENGKATCNNLSGKSKRPSNLNLQAVAEIYGRDGFSNPNNDVKYKSKFFLDGSSYNDDSYNNDYNYVAPPVTTSSNCDYTDYKYNTTIKNEKLDSGWYIWWTLCTDDTIDYFFTTDDEYDGFMIFVLPPATNVDDFVNDRNGKYYTCEEYEKKWITKGGSCNIMPGSSLVIYNYEDSAIWLDGYIRN